MDKLQNKITINDITIFSENEQIKAIDNNGKNVPFMLFNGFDTGLYNNIMLVSPNSFNKTPYVLIQNDHESKYNTNLVKMQLTTYYVSDDVQPDSEETTAIIELKEWIEVNKLPILMFWTKSETDIEKLSKLFKTFKVIRTEYDMNYNSEWKSTKIIHAKELEDYFASIKDKIIGKTIDKIFYTGTLYNSNWDDYCEYRNGEWYERGSNKKVIEPEYYQWKEYNTTLELDSPIILNFEGTRLEIMYWVGSLVNVNINSIDTDEFGADVSKHFIRNIIGHKLVDIKIHKTNKVYFMNFDHLGIERKDGDDMFEEIWFVFDNGYKLELTPDHCDYTLFREVKQ